MAGRDRKICGSGRIPLEDSSGEVVLRVVARAKESAPPPRSNLRNCEFGAEAGRATQMRTNIHYHENLRPYGSVPITGWLRQATTFIWPGFRSEMSTSTSAPRVSLATRAMRRNDYSKIISEDGS